jgi:hypothetical protein
MTNEYYHISKMWYTITHILLYIIIQILVITSLKTIEVLAHQHYHLQNMVNKEIINTG